MRRWYRVALFNLIVLALLGLLLRYKINFPLPLVKQENLLQAHAHFAFNGWITFLVQLLILQAFTPGYEKASQFWNRFFLASTLVNYTTIISFTFFGYNHISILLTTAALWLSYTFAYKIYRSLNNTGRNTLSVSFIKAALFFLVLSSLGPYALGTLISLQVEEPYWKHNALYFFLHFQYNGWFTFSILAFLVRSLEVTSAFNSRHARSFFVLLVATCIPSFLFTSLWHQRPVFVTIIITITAFVQTAALFFLWKLLRRNLKSVFGNLPAICRWLYALSITAFTIKIILQFFVVYPQVSQVAFGFRPVIIGYLHLIFLGFVTMYLLGYLAEKNVLLPGNKTTIAGLVVFVAAIVINELLLAIQGFAAICNLFLPAINYLLFANTLIFAVGAILLFVAAFRSGSVYQPAKSSLIHQTN